MASYLFRRSGLAVAQIVGHLKWVPDAIYQVGIGNHHEEADIFAKGWDGANIFGCEPHPEIYKDIKDKYPGKLYQCAIGNQIGKAVLYSKNKHKDGSSLFPHDCKKEDEIYKEINVSITTLDSLFGRSIGERTLLWLDCEGNELDVLRGGKDFICDVDVINVEMTSNPPSGCWCSPVSVHRWLMENGFLLQWTHTNRLHQGQYDSIYVKKHLFNPKYCCCPFTVEIWKSEGR